MASWVLRGKGRSGGIATGEALVSSPINFFASYMPGILRGDLSVLEDRRHELYGKSLKGKVLVFPFSIGSLAGGVSLLEAILRGVGPKAIIATQVDGVLLSAPVFARVFFGIEVPVVDQLGPDPLKTIRSGDLLKVDGNQGVVERSSNEED